MISFHLKDEKLLKKYKAIWTKIEDLENMNLNVLHVSNKFKRRTKIKTFGDKVYTSFRSLISLKIDNSKCLCR